MTTSLLIAMTPEELSALIEGAVDRALARQATARRPLTNAEAAEVLGRSPAQFRDLVHRYPLLAERAAQGVRRLRRWDRERLLGVLAELRPNMRRPRRRASKPI